MDVTEAQQYRNVSLIYRRRRCYHIIFLCFKHVFRFCLKTESMYVPAILMNMGAVIIAASIGLSTITILGSVLSLSDLYSGWN